MAVTFVSMERPDPDDSLTQQSRPVSYLKAVLDQHPSSSTVMDIRNIHTFNRLISSNEDNRSDNNLTSPEQNGQNQNEDPGLSSLPSRRDSGIEERPVNFQAGVQGSATENLDLVAFKQVITELKDEGSKKLQRISPHKTKNTNGQIPTQKALHTDLDKGITSMTVEETPDPRNESNNNKILLPAENRLREKRPQSLNSPSEVMPAYAEFRNGLGIRNRFDSVELTDL